MPNLWFEDSLGRERVIANCANGREVNNEIRKFIDDANDRWPSKAPFRSYYTRAYEADGRVILDVGSHTEFFKWDGTLDAYMEDR